MLQKHELPVTDELLERCDTLRYIWEKVQNQACKVQDELVVIQGPYKEKLLNTLGEFQEDCDDFYSTYDQVTKVYSVKKSILFLRDAKHINHAG